MDKQTVLAFVLIGIILLVWMWLSVPSTPPPPASTPDTTRAKSTQTAPQKPAAISESPLPAATAAPIDTLGRYFAGAAKGEERNILIITDLYAVELSTKGGLLRKWELKDFKTWNGAPVQLVDWNSRGDLSMLFGTSDGKLINTHDLCFKSDFPSWKQTVLKGEDSISVDFVLPVGDSARIVKHYVFRNGQYSFDCTFSLENMAGVIANYEYQIVWEHGVRYAEENSVDESSFSEAYSYAGGELSSIAASKIGEKVESNSAGTTDWVATRTKYFALIMIPRTPKAQGSYMAGIEMPLPQSGTKRTYSVALRMPYKGNPDEKVNITVFLGPLEYSLMKSFNLDLDKIMSLGAAWIIKPIAEYFVIPVFRIVHYVIPNYGLVIIIFSIFLKFLLHPLTRSSMVSMKKMQAAQPMIQEIRGKYKDDQQKMNREIMKLYKEYGINPAAGCLPMLLQLPILYALWAVFRSTIDLRQASFFWWIRDLSVPDSIMTWSQPLPVLGMTQISGLALLMSITMLIQQAMTMKDPKQKAMVYMMPALFFVMFNSLSSGLNLYYFVFNLIAIVQQVWINKKHDGTPLRKIEPKKEGGIFKKFANFSLEQKKKRKR